MRNRFLLSVLATFSIVLAVNTPAKDTHPSPSPASSPPALVGRRGEMVVEVNADGALRTGGRAVDRAAMLRLLQQEAARDPQRKILIVGDKNAKAAMIKDLLDLCTQAGVDNVGFTTNREAAAPKPAEAPDPPRK